jgi:hypothetical protein
MAPSIIPASYWKTSIAAYWIFHHGYMCWMMMGGIFGIAGKERLTNYYSVNPTNRSALLCPKPKNGLHVLPSSSIGWMQLVPGEFPAKLFLPTLWPELSSSPAGCMTRPDSSTAN